METLIGFIGQHGGFCRTQKLKLLSLVTNRPVKLVCVQNTSSIRQMYSGDQRGALGTPGGMFGSSKGNPKFLIGRPTLRSGRLS